MKLNMHMVALWSGILGSAAAVYLPIRSEIKDQRAAETRQTVERQQKIDTLNQRLGRIESHLQLIDETLPEHDRELARRLFEQVQQQVEQATEAHIKTELAPPVLAMRKMKSLSPVSADAPAVCGPNSKCLSQPKEGPQ